MTKSIPTLFIPVFVAIFALGGCNEASDSAPKIEAPALPTTPDKPDAPQGVAAATPEATTASTPPVLATDASASVTANGTEARAGDVSVKLPN